MSPPRALPHLLADVFSSLVFPPTKDDLNPSGEYKENPIPGDKLPTPTQTRPRATSEVRGLESADAVKKLGSEDLTATNSPDSSFHTNSSLPQKREVQTSSDREYADGGHEDTKTTLQKSADETKLGNGVDGATCRLDGREQAADVRTDRV